MAPPVDPSRPRIASLVPSLTGLLVALGLRDWPVARTGFCIHPAEVLRDVPKVGGTKDVNLARLRRLAPTHVVVNVDENRLDTLEALRAWGGEAPRIVVTHPLAPEDKLALVAQIATEFDAVPGVAECAQAVSVEMGRELALMRPDTRALQRVLYLIWRDPWMTVARDTYNSNLLARVNWRTLPDARALCPNAAVRRVGVELLGWYGPRAIPGLR